MKPRHAPRTAPLIAFLVVAIAAVTLILSTVTFLRNYRSSIVESARTSSAQAVSQVVGTVGDYVNTIDEVMNLVMDSMDESPEERDAFLAALRRLSAATDKPLAVCVQGDRLHVFVTNRILGQKVSSRVPPSAAVAEVDFLPELDGILKASDALV